MKTLYARHKWMQIVFGGLFLLAGAAIIIISLNWPEYISKSLSVILAISLFIFGASCIFSGIFSLRNKYFDPAFIYGDLAIALGVVLCVHNTMIQDLIVVFVGTILTTIGVVFLGEATAMIFFKRPKLSIVLFFLLGAAFLTLGILSYVFQEEATTVIYIATGSIMCLVGLVQIGFGIVNTIKGKKDISDEDLDRDLPNEQPEASEQPEIIDVQPNDENNDSSKSDA